VDLQQEIFHYYFKVKDAFNKLLEIWGASESASCDGISPNSIYQFAFEGNDFDKYKTTFTIQLYPARFVDGKLMENPDRVRHFCQAMKSAGFAEGELKEDVFAKGGIGKVCDNITVTSPSHNYLFFQLQYGPKQFLANLDYYLGTAKDKNPEQLAELKNIIETSIPSSELSVIRQVNTYKAFADKGVIPFCGGRNQ